MNRIEIPKLGYEILKFIQPQYKWLARDCDDLDGLCAYEEKPEKELTHEDSWNTYGGLYASLRAFQDLFPFITWTDEEPWSIDFILENTEFSDKDGKYYFLMSLR